MTLCANLRCTRRAAFRFTPYGKRRVRVYACRLHTTLTLIHLLTEYGGPILSYRIGDR